MVICVWICGGKYFSLSAASLGQLLRENDKPSGLFVISSATFQSMVAARKEKNLGRMNCGERGEEREREDRKGRGKETEGEVVILMPDDA